MKAVVAAGQAQARARCERGRETRIAREPSADVAHVAGRVECFPHALDDPWHKTRTPPARTQTTRLSAFGSWLMVTLPTSAPSRKVRW